MEKKLPIEKLIIKMRRVHGNIHLLLHKQGYKISKRKSWGNENPEAVYYIYRYSDSELGLLSFYKHVLTAVDTYVNRGFIPIIDYEREENFENYKVDIDNQWEYCFEQPIRISIKDIKKSKNIVFGGFRYEPNEDLRIITENYQEYYRYWKEKADKYAPIKRELLEEWTKYYKDLFGGEKVLGVCLREEFRIMREMGTAWSQNHPNEPSIKEVIDILKRSKEKYGCGKIFVTTMFQESLDAIEKAFPGEVVFIQRNRKNMTDKLKTAIYDLQKKSVEKGKKEYLEELRNKEKDGSIPIGKEMSMPYVQEMFGLSLCSNLIGTKCGGMRVAMIWNGGNYESIDLFQDEQRFY